MNIVVLCGGLSSERDVSLSSGLNCAKALVSKNHKVFLLDVFMGTDVKASDAFGAQIDYSAQEVDILSNSLDIEKIKSTRGESSDGFFGKNVLNICKKADIVFMALHGANGEDGRIQATFDLLGIKYTGSGYSASANAMNKSATRKILLNSGIRMATGVQYSREAYEKGDSNEWTTFPCIVKPCCGGSSLGVSKASTSEEFRWALGECFKYDDIAIVEEFIIGREFSVGVIDGRALPVIEIVSDGFYDYENKYSGKTREICPAQIDATANEKLQQAAERAYAALGLEVYARIDFILNEADGEPYCLEANTLPGMTPASLLPQEARVMEVEYPELCELIIQKSLEKYL